MFALLYTLATAAVWLVSLPLLPLFLLKAKYRHSLPARWLLWRNPPLPAGRLWFHACSLGETRALKPLLEAFEKEAVLSVITQTGYEAGRGLCREVRYLPFEPLLWLWERPQKALVVMEAELWFLLFYLAKARGAKTFLINARISERSYPRYMRFRWLYRRIFAQVDTVFAQSEADKARLEALGARRVEVTGNIKLAQKPEVSRRYEKPPNLVVTAASTHEGEEPGILEAFALFGKRHERAKLLLVPRHPERFERVAKLAEGFCRNAGLSFGRWRDGARFDADVVLVDRMGELVNLYAVSDIVVLGGAFVPVGGHNPAEVLPFGCRLVTGPHIFNQRAIFAAVEGARFGEMEELAEALEAALEAEPPKLRTPVTLEPIIEELRRVV